MKKDKHEKEQDRRKKIVSDFDENGLAYVSYDLRKNVFRRNEKKKMLRKKIGKKS